MVSGGKSNSGGSTGGQVPAEGAASPKDAGKSAGENVGQARPTGRGGEGTDLIRQQLEQVAAQKFPGDSARAATFMKEAGKAMGRAERDGMSPKPRGHERPQEQEASRSRDGDRDR
jgi:hypothetical protein